MVFCTKCGKENSSDAKFCFNCGAKIKSNFNGIVNDKSDIKVKKYRNVAITALINLFIAGLGFVALREYVKAVIAFIIVFIGASLSVSIHNPVPLIITWVLIIAWTADETRKHNQRLDEYNLNHKLKGGEIK